LNLNSFIDFQLALEDVHDFIHGWTGGLNPATSSDGGDMGNVGTAAYDPIFWAHHAMIDRIWYLWQLRHGVQTIPPDYLGKPLAPFSMTVEAVLDINRLGYEYGTASISLTAQ
jgi:tyrosinase